MSFLSTCLVLGMFLKSSIFLVLLSVLISQRIKNFPSFSSQALGSLLYVSPSSFARAICGLLVGAFLSNAYQFSGLKSELGETEMSALHQSFRWPPDTLEEIFALAESGTIISYWEVGLLLLEDYQRTREGVGQGQVKMPQTFVTVFKLPSLDSLFSWLL